MTENTCFGWEHNPPPHQNQVCPHVLPSVQKKNIKKVFLNEAKSTYVHEEESQKKTWS